MWGGAVKRALAIGVCLVLVVSGLAQAASPAEGRKIYRQFCQSCHGVDGGSRLNGKVDFSRGEGLLRTDPSLKMRIEAGKGFCPSFRGVIRAEGIYNVIAYLRTLQ